MLTNNELLILTAIDKSEYGDHLQEAVWTFTLADHSPLRGKEISGTVASLVKKGFVRVAGEGREMEISITDRGAAAYVKVVGKAKVRKAVCS